MTDLERTQPSPSLQPADTPARPVKPRRARRTRRLLTILGIGGIVALFLLGAATVVGGYGYYQLSGRILPGVWAGDVNLSSYTLDEAQRALAARWGASPTVSVTDGQQVWPVPASELGLTFEVAATAQRAHDVGRNDNAFSEVITLLDSLFGGHSVAPVISVDPDAARAGLESLSETVNRAPQDASLRLEGGAVVAVPGEPGLSLDVDRTLSALIADPGAALLHGSLRLQTVQVQPARTEVSPATLAEAERMLDSALVVQGYDPVTDEHVQWNVPPDTIASWLAVEDGASGPQVVVDQGRLSTYVNERSAQLGPGRHFDLAESAAIVQSALRDDATAAALIVRHDATTYTVQPGDSLVAIAWDVGVPLWRIIEANPGLDANTLSVGQTLTIPSPDELLPLPVVVGKRIEVSISQQRLRAYQDGQLLYEYVISTGLDQSPTQPGVFQVQTHEPSAYAGLWDLTMPNFLGIYEAWPGFMNGFHGLPTLSNGQILWKEVLGQPASYGCIILDLDDAQTLYNWAENGVVVEITA